MRRAALATVLVGTAAFVGFAPIGAGAADATDSGWWWRPQSGQGVTLPPPPGVPEDTLFVQGAPDGATALAAVRFELADTETAPVLQLRMAEGSGAESAATAVVLACPTSSPWRGGPNQAWTQHPEPECSRGQAVGALAEDGTSMTFDLSSFAVGPIIDLVIVPGTVEGLPEGLNGSSFSLVFEEPADGDLVTQPAGAPVTSPPSNPAPSPSPAGALSTPTPGRAPSAPPARSTPTPSFRPPETPVAPALPPSEVAGAGLETSSGVAVPPFNPAAANDTGRAKGLAIALLIAAAVVTVLAGRRQPLLRLAGATQAGGTVALAGLGRFAKERTGPPPSLR